MSSPGPFTVRQVNLSWLLYQGFDLPGEGPEYRVYWWENVPLGHVWIPDPGAAPAAPEQAWQAVRASLGYYGGLEGPAVFGELEALWTQGDYSAFGARLDNLLAPFRPRPAAPAPDMALVICTRNRPEALRRCLQSVARLEPAPAEVIVVDNAPSDDRTQRLLEEFPAVRYLREPRRGLGQARNCGWRQTTSALVAFIDDDVQVDADWAGQMARAFDRPDIQAAAGLVLPERLDTGASLVFERHWSFNRGYRDQLYDTAFFRRHRRVGVPAWIIGAGANMAFRRTVLQALGGFDPRLGPGAAGCSEDSEMWFRVLNAGWAIHYSPRAVAIHTHRRDMPALRRQIRTYMSGAVSALLIQHQRARRGGNLFRLRRVLPAFYLTMLAKGLRARFRGRFSTVPQEILGCFEGLWYFWRHRALPVPEDPLPLPREVGTMPLVSVVITTYNHARYIADAIESVGRQTHPAIELIVVDDGSGDHTRELVARYPAARYVYQEHRGLSAARNKGVSLAAGAFVLFLDADDVLYPHAVAENLSAFREHPDCAFVSGSFDNVDAGLKLLQGPVEPVPDRDHYQALLRGNYIGMHGAVLYRRQVFDYFRFDELLPSCEDYDLYLRVARRCPVYGHSTKLTAYRSHPGNMSRDTGLMMGQLRYLLRREAAAGGPDQRKAARHGLRRFRQYYAWQIHGRLSAPAWYPGRRPRRRELVLWASTLPGAALGLSARRLWGRFRRVLARVRNPRPRPAPGQVRFGDLRRSAPFSLSFGYDRGGPVDRYYIENFLADHASLIRGRVLEIGDNAYTLRYGGDRVVVSDVFHVDPAHPGATFGGDLSHADHVPSDLFDCIILTQTLHLIYDFHAALRHCHRMLKPGGVLLMTVPGVSSIDAGAWGESWYWSFTANAVTRMLGAWFDPEEVQVQSLGNVLTATAFLYGLGRPELRQEELDAADNHYPVIITARAVKRQEEQP